MRTAIISDIHSNLAALNSVLARIDSLNCDRIICLGDIIGYAADPNAVVEKVRDRCVLAIRGNHDIALLDPRQAETFNKYAQEALFWTRGELTSENTAYLRSLKDQESLDDFILAHGSLLDPDEYIFSPFQAARSLEISPSRLIFVGHTHYPEVYQYDPESGFCRDVLASEGEIELESGYKYLVNSGSVGQPRDGDYRSAFAVYDNGGHGKIELFRVSYDVHATADKIRQVGLPSMLADRLFEGR